MHVNNLNMA